MGVAVGRGLGMAGSSPSEGGGKGGESEAGGKVVTGPWLTICYRGGFKLLLDGSDSGALAGFAEGACRRGEGVEWEMAQGGAQGGRRSTRECTMVLMVIALYSTAYKFVSFD